MDDGAALICAVMRCNAKEEAVVGALVDYIQDHIPAPGESLRIEGRLRVRYGVVVLSRVPTDLGGALVDPERATVWHVKVEVFHSQGKDSCKGVRSASCVWPTCDAGFGEVIKNLFHVMKR